MALDPLATTADLTARKIDTTDTVLVAALLAAASSAVREAAGASISRETFTVKLPTVPGRRLRLPGAPVVSATDVLLDGEPVTDAVLRAGSLWRSCHWQKPDAIPSEVTVTVTAGLLEVPADVIDLVCNLVAAGLAHAAEGYEGTPNVAYEDIDDYRVGYRQGDEATVSKMELPPATRTMLRRRFGGGVAVLVTRS